MKMQHGKGHVIRHWHNCFHVQRNIVVSGSGPHHRLSCPESGAPSVLENTADARDVTGRKDINLQPSALHHRLVVIHRFSNYYCIRTPKLLKLTFYRKQ